MNEIRIMTIEDFLVPEVARWVLGKEDITEEDIEYIDSFYLRNDDMPTICYGYFIDGIARGIVCVAYNYDMDQYVMGNLFVQDGYRCTGIGKALVDHCVNTYRRLPIHMFVDCSNDVAKKLYEKCGFTYSCTNEYEHYDIMRIGDWRGKNEVYKI